MQNEPSKMSHGRILIWAAAAFAATAGLHAQATTEPARATVRGRVEIADAGREGKKRNEAIPETVVWLTPMMAAGGEATTMAPSLPAAPAQNLQLLQKNKSFVPH